MIKKKQHFKKDALILIQHFLFIVLFSSSHHHCHHHYHRVCLGKIRAWGAPTILPLGRRWRGVWAREVRGKRAVNKFQVT